MIKINSNPIQYYSSTPVSANHPVLIDNTYMVTEQSINHESRQHVFDSWHSHHYSTPVETKIVPKTTTTYIYTID